MDGGTVTALVLSGVSSATAGWSLLYGRQQARAAAHANALTERAQREQVEPYVVADIRERVPGSQLLCFFIENTGPTMARDVQLTVDPPLRTTLGTEATARLNEAVTRKISVLPPGRSLMFTMDVGGNLFESDLPRTYTVAVNCSGPFGPLETLTYTIDLRVIEHMGLNRESLEWSTHVLAEEAKKSRKAQEKQVGILGQFFRMADQEVVSRREGRSTPPEVGPPAE